MTSRRATVCVVVGVLVLGVLSSCATLQPEPKWEGRKIDEAIARYGPPTKVIPDANGKVYVWKFTHNSYSDSPGVGGMNTAREMRTTLRMMTVNADGIITSYNRQDQ